MVREKYLEIEYLRGIAILAVVAIHVVSHYSPYDFLDWLLYCKLWIDQFSHFAVPLFLFISGFVLHLRYPGEKGFDFKGFYTKRFGSVLPSYLIFTVLYWMYFEISNYNSYRDPLDLDLPRLIRHVLFSDVSIHFWFFAILFQLYFVYPFLLKAFHRFNKNNYMWLFLLLVFLVQILDCTFDTRADLIKQFLDAVLPGKLDEFKRHIIQYPVFISRLFYFVLGMYAQHHYLHAKERLKKINVRVLLVLILAIATIKTNFDFNFFQNEGFYAKNIINLNGLVNLVLNLLNILMFMKISLGLVNGNIISRFLGILGENSYGIYLVHVLFLSGLMRLFQFFSFNPNQWFYYLILFIGTMAMSNWTVEKLSRLRNSQFFIGVHKKNISA